MEKINVVVHGASGRVGQEVIKAVSQEPGMKLAGAVDVKANAPELVLPEGGGKVPYSTDFKSILTTCKPDVVVDFTIAKACMPAVRIAAGMGVNMVIGTTGFTADDLAEMEKLAKAKKVGIVVASNFALGAVLMIHLAKIAGKFFDHAEIIELHHDKKLDAPSGTAKSTVKAMIEARGKPFMSPSVQGAASVSRGEASGGINVHAVRLPGLMAHQEVIFGGAGQTLTIRHDTINRECYMPGVLMAIKEVVKRKSYIYGLDNLLEL
jgi:4-hydroxy-tetrahydrodipicolinate reductase